MSRTRLRRIYITKKIAYGRPDVLYDRALERKQELDCQRATFAKQLFDLLNSNANVIYIDETSFHVQTKPLKTWQYRDSKLQVQTPLKRPKNMTLYGACGLKIRPIFMVAKTTNTESTLSFF